MSIILSHPQKTTALAAAGLSMLMALNPAPALAGSDAYVGEIMLIAVKFCPLGSLPADGRLLRVQDEATLYSLLGNNFGGGGQREFNLPNLPAPMPGMIYCITVNGVYPQRP